MEIFIQGKSDRGESLTMVIQRVTPEGKRLKSSLSLRTTLQPTLIPLRRVVTLGVL